MKDQSVQGVAATTHLDKTGERFSKEKLEAIAREVSEDPQRQYMYWEHETTLPPIGITHKLWVEKCAEGDEYQLMFESTLFGDEYASTLIEQIISIDDDQQEMVQVPGVAKAVS